MTPKSANIVEQAKANFDVDYAVYKAVLAGALVDDLIRHEALEKFDTHAKTFLDTVREAINEAPLAADGVIVKARKVFTKSFIGLFESLGLEEELDYLIPEAELGHNIFIPPYDYREINHYR